MAIIIIWLIASLILYKIYRWYFKASSLPQISKTKYWGPGDTPETMDNSIKPFKIEFSQNMVKELINRLNNVHYTQPLEDTGFQYGFNNCTMKEIVKFWIEDYDFIEREKYFNQFPHFKTNIQGLDIHFIHIKPEMLDKNTTVVPLILLHGWPGSIREFYKVIPMLLNPKNGDNLAFELIVPSLPGFGFSQSSSKVGLGVTQMAVIMANLMERLGYSKYYVQGGDWGSIIGSHVATLFPQNVLGYHSNMPVVNTVLNNIKLMVGSVCPWLFVEKKFRHRIFPLREKISELLEETGYLHIQATKPDTLGVSLNDSPAGLAAWIIEKFSPTPDKNKADGGIKEKFTYLELIDNVMLYWVSSSATTAARIYAESLSKADRSFNVDGIPTYVPMAAARFPNESTFCTKWQLQEKFRNILQISDLPKGGHFAALEVPEIFVDDLRSAIMKFENFHLQNK